MRYGVDMNLRELWDHGRSVHVAILQNNELKVGYYPSYDLSLYQVAISSQVVY